MSLKAAGVAARDALADVLGTVGLSYRVTEDGTLFITTAARLAEDSGKKGAVIEGPPVKLTLSQPLKPSEPVVPRADPRPVRPAAGAAGPARGGASSRFSTSTAEALFAPDGLIVLAHFSRDAIDEAVLLDVFPAAQEAGPHGARWSSTASTLASRTAPGPWCKQLGDDLPKARETAETQLFELGPVAVPGAGRRPEEQGRGDRLPRRTPAAAAQPAGAVARFSLGWATNGGFGLRRGGQREEAALFSLSFSLCPFLSVLFSLSFSLCPFSLCPFLSVLFSLSFSLCPLPSSLCPLRLSSRLSCAIREQVALRPGRGSVAQALEGERDFHQVGHLFATSEAKGLLGHLPSE